MGGRTGVAGLLDRLRYNEIARQGLGLLLLPICAWYSHPAFTAALFTASGDIRVWVGLALALIGQVWRIYAAGVIHKNKQLATTGAYSLVRHPLYLGNLLILGGFTLACANWVVIAVVVFFFLFYYPAAIRYEDRKLENIFGDDWRQWSQGTPAMFPTSLKWTPNTDAEWNARQSMIRNGELWISIYLAASAWLLLYRSGLMS